MKTRGINRNLDNCRYEYGTQEYFEISLKSMLNSCFTYNNNYSKGSYYYDRYIKPRIDNLPEGVGEEVYKEHTEFLENNCYIEYGVFTDHEGCTYNSLKYK